MTLNYTGRAIFSQSVSLTQYVVLFTCLSACLFQLAYCLNDQAYNCLIHFRGSTNASQNYVGID